jgi:hypothetical protein
LAGVVERAPLMKNLKRKINPTAVAYFFDLKIIKYLNY